MSEVTGELRHIRRGLDMIQRCLMRHGQGEE